MKVLTRALTLLLCFLMLCSSLTACKDEATAPESGKEGGETPSAETILPEDLPTTRKLSAFTKHYFAVGESNAALELMLPSGWRAEKGEGLYTLYENENRVGLICAGEHDGNMTLAAEKTAEGIAVNTYVGKLTRNKAQEPYYQTVYTYGDASKAQLHVLVEVKQSAMDGALMQWLTRPAAEKIRGFNDVPALPLSEGNGKTKILILGNSFVNPSTSAIAEILKEMIDTGEKECTVHRFSLGYATVSKYATDTGTNFVGAREYIESGEYNLVLLCGLYGSEDVTALAEILKMCEEAGSRLVLLPAHNEASKRVEAALSRYEGMPCLNWKQEIDGLIGAGIERSLFCINDAHSHSTKLAGYVGAHMIYRALFGERPPEDGYAADAIINRSLTAPLGDYETDGMWFIPQSKIKYI